MLLSLTRHHMTSLSKRAFAPTMSHRCFSDGPSTGAIDQRAQTSFQVSRKDPSTLQAKLDKVIQENAQLQQGKAQASSHQHSVNKKGLPRHGDICKGQFNIDKDDVPEMFADSDTDKPNPIESLFHSLASCQKTTYKAYAKAMSIPLKSVTINLTGDIDFRGFFSMSADVRPGFKSISGAVTIDSPATMEQLEQLKAIVDSRCPVTNVLNVPISLDLVKA